MTKKVLDLETRKIRNSNSEDLHRGVVSINKKGQLVMGYFSRNPGKNYTVTNKSDNRYLTFGELHHPNYKIGRNNGGYYFTKDAELVRAYEGVGVNGSYSVPTDYTVGYRMAEFVSYSRKNFSMLSKSVLAESANLGIRLGTTIGIEYESFDGMIPEPKCFQAGMIPVKDGSLRRDGFEAYEYATIPMSGSRANRMIALQCDTLVNYCNKSNDEALHIHVGNDELNRSKHEALLLFKVAIAIQDELYSIVPRGMKNTGEWKRTGNNYCSPLNDIKFSGKINEDYQKLYNYLTSGNPSNAIEKAPEPGSGHPNDREGRHKWNVGMR